MRRRADGLGAAFERVEILEELRNAQHDDFGTVGKGTERRFDAVHVQGSWKEIDGSIQDLIILPKAVHSEFLKPEFSDRNQAGC